MNTRSIHFRLTAWYCGLLVVLGLAFGAYCFFRLDYFLSLYLTEIFSSRAKRIADTLLRNVEQTGDAYVRSEIEARFAPESNNRFIRVTRGDGLVIYLSGQPNDQSFDPKDIAQPSKALSNVSARIEHVGSNDLLISAVPFVTDGQKYVIEVGESALPI
jgi:hypothetical protein